MILYHGTLDRYAYNILTNGIDLNKSKPLLDFGKGFYTTSDRALALRTAKTRTNSNNKFQNSHALPAIVKMKIDDSVFNNLRVKEFKLADDEWANFIINNRCNKEYIASNGLSNHNHNFEYDIVIGGTADGNVSNIAYEVMNNIFKIDADVHKILLTKEGKDFGQQISFHTNEVIACIKILEYAIIR